MLRLASFEELFRQLVTLICKTGFWDVKYDNVPLSPIGDAIFLVDLDYSGRVDTSDLKTAATVGIFDLLSGDSQTVVPQKFAVPHPDFFVQIQQIAKACIEDFETIKLAPFSLKAFTNKTLTEDTAKSLQKRRQDQTARLSKPKGQRRDF